MHTLINATDKTTIATCDEYEDIYPLLRSEQARLRRIPGSYERIDVLISNLAAIPYRVTASRIERIV